MAEEWPQRHPGPNLSNLGVSPYLQKDFADVMKLRVLLRWGEHPGLSRWALNVISSVLTRGRQREIGHRPGESYETMEAEVGAMRP